MGSIIRTLLSPLSATKMSAQIIDGKATAAALRKDLAIQTAQLVSAGSPAPGLAVILVGSDAASEVYVRNKRKACAEVGFNSRAIDLPVETTESALLILITELNEDNSVDGILVQLPLPAHIDAAKVISAISPEKDVDGFHPHNIGLLVQRLPGLRPCTPKGIMHLLEQTDVDFHRSHAVIVGASNIVGRPMALELLLAGATVTVCHRFTEDLASHVARADILVVAIGKPGIVQSQWIKPGARVIDVGVNRQDDGSLCGDIEFATAKQQAAWITPVPGGVGPMTIAMLLSNTLEAAGLRRKS